MVRSVARHGLAAVARGARFDKFPSGGVGVPFEDRLDLVRLIYVASELLRQGEVSGAGQVLAEVCARTGAGRRWGAGWALRGMVLRDWGITAEPAADAQSLGPASAQGPLPPPPLDAGEAGSKSMPISIYALGGFELIIGGVRFSSGVKPQRKPLELLKVLLLSGGAPLGAVELADKLWPDSDGDTGRNSLQVAVHRLRRLLACDAALVMQDRKLRLDPGVCWVDLWTFEREAQQLACLPVGRSDFATRAARTLRLYRGHLFAHEPEHPWMLAARERLRRCWLDLVRRVGQHYEMLGEWSRARDLYQRTVDLDPLAEETYRRLMLCQQKTGARVEALHTYLRCRDQLGAALGVKPSMETERLYETLRSAA